MKTTALAGMLALALPVQPSAASPPIVVVPESQQPAAFAFLAKVADALTVQIAGMRKLGSSQALMQGMTTPTGLRENAPRLRALVVEARAAIRQADAMLATSVPPQVTIGTGLTPAGMLAEARDQNARAVRLLDAYDGLLAALEHGDRAAAARIAPRLFEGALVLVDGQGLMIRGRQAALPESHSTHQILDIPVQLYRAEAAAGRSWYSARVGGQAEAGAALLDREAGAAARILRAATAAGRTHLAAERAPIEAALGTDALSAKERTDYASIRAGWAMKERLFGLGDELATLLEANRSVSGAALAAQPTPKLLGELSAFELRYSETLAGSAAGIAAGHVK